MEPPEQGSFRTRDGAELPCRHYPGDSDRHLVLVHGSGSHSAYLAPLARELSRRGVAQVHTPDLRGHGVAPERRGDIDHIDQLEEDLADLVAHIGDAHAGARVAVGGHSSGGGLALRFAGSAHGRAACAFVLLAPFLRHDAPTTRKDAGGWARPKIARIVALSVLNGFGIHALDGTTTITFDMPEAVRDGSETLAYSHRLNTGFAPRHYATDLAAISVPLLVLVGAEDEAFVAERFESTVKSHAANAEVAIVPGATHLGLVGAAACAARLGDWLAKL